MTNKNNKSQSFLGFLFNGAANIGWMAFFIALLAGSIYLLVGTDQKVAGWSGTGFMIFLSIVLLYKSWKSYNGRNEG